MSKRRVATLLIGLAMLGLLPFLPQVWAYATAEVNLPVGAAYGIESGNTLISCSVPTTITVDAKLSSASGNFVRCVNNYGGTVTLNWSLVSGPSGMSLAGNSGAFGANDAPCRPLTINYTNLSNNAQNVVRIRGVTASTADFYVELEFPATIVGRNNQSPSGGCA